MMATKASSVTDDLRQATALHRQAVAEYAAAARRVAEQSALWNAQPSSDKWSPAQITLHLVLAFEVAGGELEGGPGMAMRVPRWILPWLRLTTLRRMLRGGPFPRGARSPRELRPPTPSEDAASLIRRFETLAVKLEEKAANAGRSARFTHAYFGKLNMEQTLRVSALHIQHHRTQLPDVS